MAQKSTSTAYVSGHQESVLRSHSWRTAANSAGYLLDSLLPHMQILDVGCGPGTITADLAVLVPNGHVTGLDSTSGVLDQARATANERNIKNIEFVEGDILKLDYPDDSFDVVHAHQVVQHVPDHVGALREMRRVCRPGGLVACRELDFSTMTFYPEDHGLGEWKELWLRVARAHGSEPDAGRRLKAWAHEAGFDWSTITTTTGSWCYSTREERAWWSGLWADRTVASSFAKNAVDGEHATEADLARIRQAWLTWGAQEDAWYGDVHGQILCRV
ncbi:MAG: hypothetical protein M1812_007827 [Candelaria pacifica]|nr:MAG: hypothetical protein M1812_007827 [Candelaria pacifica]